METQEKPCETEAVMERRGHKPRVAGLARSWKGLEGFSPHSLWGKHGPADTWILDFSLQS